MRNGLVTSIKGDWKHVGQLLNARVEPSSNEICHKCKATKNLTVPFTDVSEAALWRAQPRPQDEVWYERPSIAGLNQWSVALVVPGLMHTYAMGVGRDCCLGDSYPRPQKNISWK